MKSYALVVVVLLLMEIYSGVDCKRVGGGSFGRRGSSRGKSTTSSSSGGWFSWSKSTNPAPVPKAAPVPAPAPPKQTYGWTNPKPAAPAPQPPSGWSKPVASAPQPPSWSNPGANAAKPATYGWQNPTNKATAPSSNIGPGGYPVQGGIQRSPPPYSPPSNVKPPAYSPPNSQGSFGNTNTRVAPPSYSPTNPHSPPAYSGPKKQVINNHYHYNNPPAAQPSHYGMGSNYYPTQNSFGYPSGGSSFFGRPKYNGMGLFGGGGGSYGYPGSGSWGGYPSYGSGRSGSGGLVKGLLIGAATGYVANSLIRTVTNPWGYSGYGYGHGYMDRYRHGDYNRPTPAPAVAAAPESNWINCVAVDPQTKVTMINPNCTCSVSVVTDPNTGLNTSHHDCTPYNQPPPGFVHQQPLPTYGAQNPPPAYGPNNPPPSFNGSMYGADAMYGGAYGAGYGGAAPMPPPEPAPEIAATAATVNSEASAVVSSTAETVQPPQSEQQTSGGDAIAMKRAEFYSQLEKMVNMGRFAVR